MKIIDQNDSAAAVDWAKLNKDLDRKLDQLAEQYKEGEKREAKLVEHQNRKAEQLK